MSFTIFQNEKRPFQAIKTRSSKSRKIDIFLKGLTHGFGPKIPIFPTLFFQAIQARKMSFTIFQNERTPFQALKTRRSKTRQIDIFPKGLTHGIGPEMAIFPTFLLRQYRPEKCLLRYSRTKKMPFQAIKKRSSKSRKIHIFLKWLNHGFVKTWPFFQLFSLSNIGQENVFYDIPERKIAFLGQNNKKF